MFFAAFSAPLHGVHEPNRICEVPIHVTFSVIINLVSGELALHTELALSRAWHEIVAAAEEEGLCLAAFLDVAKVLDCLDVSMFVSMLDALGCSANKTRCFCSYLGRVQEIRMDGMGSTAQTLEIDTPQGSALGPYIFIIYINLALKGIDKGIE